MFQQYVKGWALLFVLAALACEQAFAQRKSPAAATPQKTANNGGLNGLYAGERFDFTFVPNVFGAGGGSYQNKAVRLRFYFLPDGRAFRGVPAGGLERFDYDAACRGRQAHCGQYQRQGNQVVAQWNDGNTTQLAVTGPRTLGGPKMTLYRVEPVRNLKLEGVWGFTNFVSSQGAGGNVSVSSDKAIAFNRQGEFAVKNFVGYSAVGSVAGAGGSQDVTGKGAYLIEGNTLVLNFAGVGTASYTFWVHPQDRSVIVVDGVNYITR
jgi:hypothetical protein